MICSVCHQEIPAKKQYGRYCFCCRVVFHKNCAKNGDDQCPLCGAKSCDTFWEPPTDLEAFIRNDAARTVYFEVRGAMPKSENAPPGEQEVLSYVRKRIRVRKIGSLIGGIVLIISGVMFLYFGYLAATRISAFSSNSFVINPVPRILISLVLFGVALMAFWLGIKSLRDSGGGSKPKSPEEVVGRFYTIALNSDPLAVSKLMALLHPSTAWALLHDPDYADRLRDEWYRIRRECAAAGGSTELPAPWVYRTEITCGSQSDYREVLVATKYGMDMKLGGRQVFYFKNKLADVDGSWAIIEPYPGAMTSGKPENAPT